MFTILKKYCCRKMDGNKFSMILNFFDVISIFFRSFFDVSFLCLVFLCFVFSMFCFSMFCRSICFVIDPYSHVSTRVKTAWKKFKELKPVLSSRHLSFKTPGRVYSSCVWSTMLHARKTWPLTKPSLQRLQ